MSNSMQVKWCFLLLRWLKSETKDPTGFSGTLSSRKSCWVGKEYFGNALVLNTFYTATLCIIHWCIYQCVVVWWSCRPGYIQPLVLGSLSKTLTTKGKKIFQVVTFTYNFILSDCSSHPLKGCLHWTKLSVLFWGLFPKVSFSADHNSLTQNQELKCVNLPYGLHL